MKTDWLLLATMLPLFSLFSMVLRKSPTDAWKLTSFYFSMTPLVLAISPGLQGTGYLVTDHRSATPNLTRAFNKTSKGKMWKLAAVSFTAIVMH